MIAIRRRLTISRPLFSGERTMQVGRLAVVQFESVSPFPPENAKSSRE